MTGKEKARFTPHTELPCCAKRNVQKPSVFARQILCEGFTSHPRASSLRQKAGLTSHHRVPSPRTTSGFTLIELLVVVAIIGILSATILLLFDTARQSAVEARMQRDMIAVHQNVIAEYAGMGDYGTAVELQDPCDFGVFAATSTQYIVTTIESYTNSTVECAVGVDGASFSASVQHLTTGNSTCVSDLGVFINDNAAGGDVDPAICE